MHGINNGWMRLLVAVVLFSVLVCFQALAEEGGMIPLDSPAGEIGGRGHWYSLRTMKGSDYYSKPPVMSDIKEGEGHYSVSGEPPVELSIVLHPLWGDDSGEPWREAINWVREAEQMFRNSGVPIRFVVTSIDTDYSMPDTVESAYHATTTSPWLGDADLLVVLLPYVAGDPWCGVASVGGIRSVSACSPVTLAHELGHNFGLGHSFNGGYIGKKGYCMRGEDGNDCIQGTIMSYAGNGRVRLFANKEYTYDGLPLGDEEHHAVEYLNSIKTKKALRFELSTTDYVETFSHSAPEAEPHLCR